MRSIATISIAALLTAGIIIGIPAVLGSCLRQSTHAYSGTEPGSPSAVHRSLPTHDLQIHLYLSKQHQMIKLPLEQYVKGVVSAEMPTTFQPEALKAQAVAARTNIIRQMIQGQKTPEGADITDDYHNAQAYLSDDDLKRKWGSAYEANLQKVIDAVADTQTEILSYGSSPIDAKFFSTSNGQTESSQAYWGRNEPYLQSVPCPWDLSAPHHSDTLTLPLEKILLAAGSSSVAAAAGNHSALQVLAETASHRVDKVRVGSVVLSGADFRSKLIASGIQLYSTDFSVSVASGEATFITHGYGHGVGMSQYGANGMAESGKKYQEILSYFYKGTQLDSCKKWISY